MNGFERTVRSSFVNAQIAGVVHYILSIRNDDRPGQYSISINDQWRICFVFLDGDAYEVEITDYH